MRFGYEVFYGVQWVIFLLRMALNFVYGILQFIAKPGSRYIIPFCIAVVGYLNLSWFQSVVADAIDGYYRGASFSVVELVQRNVRRAYYGHATDEWQLNLALIVLFLLACGAYVVVSRVLSLVMGAFPRITRPLRPMRKLRPTSQKITSAVVVLAVPKLRRSWL